MSAALEIHDLNAWYGESHVLHGINLTVHPGEVVCLLGRGEMFNDKWVAESKGE